MQRCSLHSLALFAAVIMVSCGTDALQVSGEWHFEGLEGVAINKIIPSSASDRLILATDDGVFIYEEDQFTPVGLQGEEVNDLVEMGEDEILAGIRTTTMDGGEDSLFKTTDGGATWQVHMGNYGGEERKHTSINALAQHPDDPRRLYARGWLNVPRSLDGGQTWESLYRDWEWFGMNASLLRIDPNNPDIIWAGGANTLSRPNLLRTTDGGETWENLLFELQIFEAGYESTAYSIAIRPGRSSHLLLGLGVGVFRSTDLGKSWESVFDQAAVLAMANSPRFSRAVYAAGFNQQQTLFLLVTPDFGSTWKTIEKENSPSNIHVNDLTLVEQDGQDVLYFGTNRGVFSYRIDR